MTESEDVTSVTISHERRKVKILDQMTMQKDIWRNEIEWKLRDEASEMKIV